MSKEAESIEGPITENEILDALRSLVEKSIRQNRVKFFLNKACADVEKLDMTCAELLMNAEDYHVVRKWAGDPLDIVVDSTLLQTGLMAHWMGIQIRVNRHVKEIFAVPVVPEHIEGCFVVLAEHRFAGLP